ncbi:MAG: DNA-binding protein WhiA [Coriobacteriales bacterium]|jgi:DNA-binding protein WhiA|nr:DNA-binding protein WhiA [Coriobacteriales bacterium]
MSFNAEVKDELMRLLPAHKPCQKAELSALIKAQGQLSSNYRLQLLAENAPAARITVELLHNLYDLKTEVTTLSSHLHQTFAYQITVPVQLGLKETLGDLGIISYGHLQNGIPAKLLKGSECESAFLRGMFLATGRISDPSKEFHLEFSCTSLELQAGISALMLHRGIRLHSLKRHQDWLLYLKGAEAIMDMLAFLGAAQAVLKAENIRVTRQIKGEANRKVNAEIANQSKSIDASLEQVRKIQYLSDNDLLATLPKGLRAVAELRLAHPEVSLKQLGQLAQPKLSKSAIYHRIRRLEMAYDDAAERSILS